MDYQRAIVVAPGETYVEFQLAAQLLCPELSLFTVGYGECGAGYLPIEQAWRKNDDNLSTWCWTAAGAENAMLVALRELLRAP